MSSLLVNEFEPADDHAAIREGVRAVVNRFGDDYWLARDDDGVFPFEFHRAMAMPAGSASRCRKNMAVPVLE
jgi:acyl-CoA dehydrogenase